MARLRILAIAGWAIAAMATGSTVYLGYEVREQAAAIESHEARHTRTLDRFARYAGSRDRIEEYQRQGLID